MIYAILVFTACYIVFVLLLAELPRWLRKRRARKNAAEVQVHSIPKGGEEMKKGEPFIVQDTAGRYSARGGGYTKDLQKAGVMREDSGSWSKEYWRIIPVVVTIKVKK